MGTKGIHQYKKAIVHRVCDVSVYLRQCADEWNKLQEEWTTAGAQHAHIAYPYTEEEIKVWQQELKTLVGARTADDSLVATSSKPIDDESLYDWWSTQSRDANFCWNVISKNRKKFVNPSSRSKSTPPGGGG